MTQKIKWERVLNTNNMGHNLNDALYYRKNKNIAYDEGLQEFIDTSIPNIINYKEYLLHPNINTYIDLTSKCGCNCEFCIAKTQFDRNNNISKFMYLTKLEKAMIELKNVDTSIQVTGGEPTLSSKIYEVIDLIDKYKIKRPVLNTTGHGLFNKLIDRLNNSTFEHINISRHHYNDILNDDIMNPSIKLSSTELYNRIKLLNIPVRVQCNMVKGYIDTYGEVMQFIAYAYHKLGCDNVVFAQLTPLPENTMYKQSIIDYVYNRQVDIDEILEHVGKDSRFSFKKYRGGVACYYEVWEYTAYETPITVLFKFSDNKYLEIADSYENYLPDLIIHTDGTLCGSWNKNKKVLLK